MSLYYDMQIRPVVIKQWDDIGLMMSFGNCLEIPEDQVDPKDSSLFKDTRIPLTFKNEIAVELYSAEEEEIKKVVRSKRKYSPVKTIYSVSSEEERMELVLDYQK